MYNHKHFKADMYNMVDYFVDLYVEAQDTYTDIPADHLLKIIEMSAAHVDTTDICEDLKMIQVQINDRS